VTCSEIRPLLPLLADPEVLEPGEKARAETHLATCRPCRDAQAELARAFAWAPGEAEAPPPAVWDRIVAAAGRRAAAGPTPAAGSADLLFGKIALNRGLLSRDLLQRALEYQRTRAPEHPLGEVLAVKGLLTRQQVDEVLAFQRRVQAIRVQASRDLAAASRSPTPTPTPGQVSPSPLPGGVSPSPLPGGVSPSPLPGGVSPSPLPGAAAAALASAGPEPEDDPWLGRRVGSCVLAARLGVGAMGRVYLARHEGLQKDVVVKLAREGLPPKIEQRFLREARAAARIDHPSVIRVHDVGRTADGIPFMVMEHVDGEDLEARLRQSGRCSPAEAVGIVREAAGALAAAHAAGIVHRDVKADNLLLTRSGRVKVADFGTAKDCSSPFALTADGAFIGTPLYMAPEVGRVPDVDGRVDVYSLGVTFYYLLTGVQPFRRFSAMDILRAEAHGRIDSPLRHAPDLPAGHERVLAKMLARDRDRRYPSMDALLADLDALARGEAPAADVPGPWCTEAPAAPAAARVEPAARTTFTIIALLLGVGALLMVLAALLRG